MMSVNAQLRNERDAVMRELHDIEGVLREAYPNTALLGDTLARKVVRELIALRLASARLSRQLRHAYGIATEDERQRVQGAGGAGDREGAHVRATVGQRTQGRASALGAAPMRANS
jgi:hypothetical protein